MRRLLLPAFGIAGICFAAMPAAAASCYDLWYERNQIYNDHGYCFETQLGRDTFDNSDCYTRHPRLAAWEQRRVEQIQREEWRRGCKVNN